MAVQTTFFDWQRSGLDWNDPIYEVMSPNLIALNNYLVATYGGQPLGSLDDYDRPIRGGTLPSTHAYGAAVDWRYSPPWLTGTTAKALTRELITARLLPWMINFSKELGIDCIHDYVGDRIWRAGRTSSVADAHTLWWKTQNGAGEGMGESWATYLHIETTPAAFNDARAITTRFTVNPVELIKNAPPPALYLGQPDNTDTRNRTRWLQQICNERFGTTLVVDGMFGAATVEAVKRMQTLLARDATLLGVSAYNPGPADGWYGAKTATALQAWLAVR